MELVSIAAIFMRPHKIGLAIHCAKLYCIRLPILSEYMLGAHIDAREIYLQPWLKSNYWNLCDRINPTLLISIFFTTSD